jgi:hypothetical protein
MFVKKLIFLIIVFILGLYLIGCFPASHNRDQETETTTETTEEENNPEITEVEDADGVKIMNIASTEQDRPMYSPQKDSTYLYWLNNQLAFLKGYTKCNIYALNVLYKSGYKTPRTNALCRDLVDTTRFQDIMPVVGVKDASDAKKGDLIIWRHHVIIFEAMTTQIKNDIYATAWWAGTNQKDNGENIRNNVIYGKYRLSGNYIVRRPVRK